MLKKERKIHEFKESLGRGDIGEDIIEKFLDKNETLDKIVSVRDNKIFRDMDVDYVSYRKSGLIDLVEVKTDYYKSPNIFYEVKSCVETNSLGCMEKTKADYLFYFFIETRELYILDMKKMREWVRLNSDKFRFINDIKNKRYDNSIYHSSGYLIKKKFLERFSNIHKKIIMPLEYYPSDYFESKAIVS